MERRGLAGSALCLAVALACGGGSTSGTSGTPQPLDADYASSFVGTWEGTLTASWSGQRESYATQLPIRESARNALALDGFCPDGSAATALATAPNRFAFQPFSCPPSAVGTCPSVTVHVLSGTGLLAAGTLTMDVAVSESVCGEDVSVSLSFTGTIPTPPDQAPVVSVTLSPAVPKPTDEIVAHVSAGDPDGDPLTVTYAWKLNGALLAGQTGPSLPAGTAGPDDDVTVVVTASDGKLSATAEASVTVSGVMLAVSPPAEAPYGDPVSFQVTATGGAPGDFFLEYGPAGMEVNAAGLVTWTPVLPMFDRGLDVHFSVGAGHARRSHATGTIRVSSPGRALPLFRSGIRAPSGRATLVVTDLDDDGRAEVLVGGPSGAFELARSGAGYVQRWAYPLPAEETSGVSAIAAADVDGDGMAEIFLAAGDTVVELDGATRREVARASSGGAFACRELAIRDVEPDAKLELVCLGGPVGGMSYGNDGTVVVYDAGTLAQRWSTPWITGLGVTLAIGNVDRDASLEIVTSGGYVFDGSTGLNEWAYGAGFGQYVGVGDLDGDGVDEIVGAQAWNAFQGFSAVRKAVLWSMSRFNPGAVSVADIDADGRAEILIGDAQWGNLTAFRQDAGASTLSTVFDLGGQGSISAIGVGDVDGDGALEYVFGSETLSPPDYATIQLVVAGRNPGIGIEWLAADPAQLDGPFVGAKLARLGGGARALLFAIPSTDNGYGGSRLVALDPGTGSYTTSQELGSNWNREAALDVGDPDQDGVDEAFLATSTLYDGYLVSYDVPARSVEWSSPSTANDDGVSVRRADLDADGVDDVIEMTAAGSVRAYDVHDQTLLWQGPTAGAGADVVVANLDGVGSPEIIAAANGQVVVYGKVAGPAGYVALASAAVPGARSLLVADTFGFGVQDIYVLASTFYGGGPATIYRFDASLSLLGSITVDALVQSLDLEDLGGGRKNLLVGIAESDWYSSSPHHAVLVAIDPRNGGEVWRSPGLWGTVQRSSLSYLTADDDGRPLLGFGTARGMVLTQ
jgi:hypothetical protein